MSWGDRPREIAEFLRQRAQPGDQVQPLDWLGGTSRAMLMAESMPATPLLEDLFLYVRVKEPFVMALRQDFLRRLSDHPPRFIIQVRDGRIAAYDPQDTSEFQDQLFGFIAGSYAPALNGAGYTIYERNK